MTTSKLPDDMLGGVYANMASISHTENEFCFDFIAQFFPRSAVTARESTWHLLACLNYLVH